MDNRVDTDSKATGSKATDSKATDSKAMANNKAMVSRVATKAGTLHKNSTRRRRAAMPGSTLLAEPLVLSAERS